MKKHDISIDQVTGAARDVAKDVLRLKGNTAEPVVFLYGVPRGGIPAAYAVAAAFNAMDGLRRCQLVDDPNLAHCIIDDIVDSGVTSKRYSAMYPGKPFYALFNKSKYVAGRAWNGTWLTMPWERSAQAMLNVTAGKVDDESATDIVTRLLQYIGEDPTREGLADTPKRFLKAWREWASGYGQEPSEVLRTFEDGAAGYNEMVVVHNVPVVSKCEHHLADIVGTAHVAYIPKGRIVGLSKLARVVDIYARRLQVQERMTSQIADAIEEHLQPEGVGVVIRATHGCMVTRGVRAHDSVTTTSALRGCMADAPVRKEFLDLCRMAEASK